ncbi:S8 family serine peptidase [Nonomuraea sp. FMUSA5-5]|uniref:S8 family serine peptidase n=1 Tax=Nonomuraea composti TaxID=2720023 RepID=A0ABX1B997_9ACTN|nr:S8 family serine peptidase [Nonomuraea sp. FMUSA5-5]NJP92879.1 S8 family serine peptidase [Nonomuraea sp. FMUSA5-5]
MADAHPTPAPGTATMPPAPPPAPPATAGTVAPAAPPAARPAPDPPSSPPRHPTQAIPGIEELRRRTGGGDPGITIGVIDGVPDLAHPSLAGARVRRLPAWWEPPAEPDAQGVEHGTWTAGVLSGQAGSILPGLAPRCRALFLSPNLSEEHPADPLSAARAIDELVEAGADLIQVTYAFSTASDDADPLLKRAVARALDQGVLVTAPAGNNYGENSIAVANLPGVLAVGAHRADGRMFFFSNHGPAYTGHGLTALGEAVYGPHPDGGIKAQKGTCVAVALVTGAVALLLSLQRHLGHRPDALAVRDALLSTARPCTAEQAHGKPARCLNGYLDLPAATAHLLADPGATASATPGPPLAPPRPMSGGPPAIADIGGAHQRPAEAPQVARRRPDVRITTLAERPDLAPTITDQPAHQGRAQQLPLFLAHDLAARWSAQVRLHERFPQFAVVATDDHGQVVARGAAVPFALMTPERGKLPDGGWDDLLTWAHADLQHATPPDTLGLLAITVQPDHRGTGLPARLLDALKTAARAAGLAHVAAPVRPTRKHHEPRTPMADYARRTRPEDGLPADPWLRTHVRAGGTIIGLAPASMTVTGSLAQWRAWTGLPFDTDGEVIVPGALVPVHASLAHGHAVYAEPNVWVHHPAKITN